MSTTYSQFAPIHKAILVAKNGDVTDQVFRNHTSTLKGYLAFCSRSEESPIGREFSVDFSKKSSAFANHVGLQNRKTAADKLSILRSWKRSIDMHSRESALKSMAGQSVFHKELRLAIANSGMTLNALAAAINSDVRVLKAWSEGVMPIYRGLPTLRRLENELSLERGYLESKLVFPTREGDTENALGSDQFSLRFKTALADPYYFPSSNFTGALLEEWTAFLFYKTDLHPIGLKRGNLAKWRTLPFAKADAASKRQSLLHPAQGLVCPSARATLGLLRSFLGFLTKERTADPASSGLGLNPDDVSTLGVLAVPEFVSAYFNFMKARAGNIVHNGHANSAGFIVAMCREEIGYLWQQPEVFSTRVAKYAKGRTWADMCRKTVELCNSWQKGGQGNKSRDPSALLQPLLALPEMLEPFKRAIKKLDLAAAAATTGSVHQALFKRDALIVAISLFNPLRQRTLSIAKYIPSGSPSDVFSNLYKDAEGQWRLRFEKGDFKNDGSKQKPYDSPITMDLSERIEQYLNVYRPILIRGTPGSAVLFPSKSGEQMKDMGSIIDRAGKNFIPELRRVRLHLLRHIVATNFLRKNPGKYTLLAGLLHDTLATVLKTYAHGKTESAFRAQEENMKDFFSGL